MSFRQIIMSVTRRASRRRLRVTVVAAVLVALSAAAISAGILLKPAQEVAEVRITLRSDGFDPSEVTRRAERFRLTVVNSSGREELTFRLMRVGGEQVHQSLMARGAAQWSEEFDLPEGQYALTEIGNPAWLFYVTVR
ncbi:MAG: cupredoxin domain-containing protein [Acidobacteria bacterium]|nr:cupredoxin domain-containing protein [Acidobacteriota bacterium]